MNRRRSDEQPAAASAELANGGDGRPTDNRRTLMLWECVPVWFPELHCKKHGRQPTGYYLCQHVVSGDPVDCTIPATRGFTGSMICKSCAETTIGSKDDISALCRLLRLACCHCLHAEGLLKSPEVLL